MPEAEPRGSTRQKGLFLTGRPFARTLIDASPAPAIFALAAAGIFASAYLGYAFTIQPAGVSVVWLPAGFLLGLLLIAPRRLWLAIALGAIAGNLAAHMGQGAPPLLAGARAAANVVEGLAAAWLVLRVSPAPMTVSTLRQLNTLLAGAVVVSNAVTALLGALVVVASTQVPFWYAWFMWWAGDGMGMIIVAPAILVFAGFQRRDLATWRTVVEGGILFGAIVAAAELLLGHGAKAGQLLNADPYMIMPLLFWAAIRFGPRGSATATLCVTAVTLWHAVQENGPFLSAEQSSFAAVFQVHAYLTLTSVSGLVAAVILRERQSVQEELRESEARFRRIAETITEVFWIADVGLMRMDYVSAAYEEIWGRSCASLYENPRSFLEAVHPDDRERVLATLRLNQAFEHEYRIVRPDGSIRWVFDRGVPVLDANGAVVQFVGAAQDITSRRLADEHSRLLANAVESTNEMVSVTDLNDRLTFVNSAFLRAYGYRRDEVIGQAPALLQSPAVPAKLLEEIEAQTRAGGWRGELINRRKDGSELYISLNTAPIRDAHGALVGLLGVASDVSDRVRAERRLRDVEERMHFALRAAGVGIWEVNVGKGVTFWSETCEAIHGLEPGTFSQTFEAFLDRVHPDDRTYVSETLDRAMRERLEPALEYRTVWPDGSVHFISSTGRFFYDRAGTPLRGAGIVTDMTDRRTLEEQLRQSQKMEAVGQLAGGVAHDFNNLLTAILGYAGLLSESVPETDPHRGEIDEIVRAAERAARLTQQLLAFSRRQVLAPQVLSVGHVINDLAPMLRRLLGESIDLRAIIGDSGVVRADAGQLEQVLVNLAVNAADAMPDGGRLTIETADVRLDDDYARAHAGVAAGPYIMLAVSDTGHGMDAKTQHHVFEPFFTTKPKGRGTGLGLSVVHGIVKQSGGHVWLYSEVDRGTTFKIYLPRTDAAVEAVRPESPAAQAEGSETILLVEDEVSVGEFVNKVLARKGYTIHQFCDPEQAVEFVGSHSGTIDMVLTDVVLPGMSGPALAGRVRDVRPDAKVLFMSGYTEGAITHQALLDPGMAFLQKPFSAAALTGRIRALLDAR